jgi:hypothetical protein
VRSASCNRSTIGIPFSLRAYQRSRHNERHFSTDIQCLGNVSMILPQFCQQNDFGSQGNLLFCAMAID